jgi:hypothetical protein
MFTKTYDSVLLGIMITFSDYKKQMNLTFQQIYVEDNQTLYNKHSCMGSGRMNLLIKREKRAIKNWNTQ